MIKKKNNLTFVGKMLVWWYNKYVLNLEVDNNDKRKPFVKWAGGKRQIIAKLLKYAPDKFNTYYEPFVGGGLYYLNYHKKSSNKWLK